jgi:hypothetical protein
VIYMRLLYADWTKDGNREQGFPFSKERTQLPRISAWEMNLISPTLIVHPLVHSET